jgi:hypothetical protein
MGGYLSPSTSFSCSCGSSSCSSHHCVVIIITVASLRHHSPPPPQPPFLPLFSPPSRRHTITGFVVLVFKQLCGPISIVLLDRLRGEKEGRTREVGVACPFLLALSPATREAAATSALPPHLRSSLTLYIGSACHHSTLTDDTTPAATDVELLQRKPHIE